MSIVKYPRQSGWVYDPATFDDGIAFVDGDSIARPRNGLTANAGSPLPTDGLGRAAINAQNVNCAVYFKHGDNGQIGPTDGSAQTNTSTTGDYQTTGPVAAFAAVGTNSGTTGYSKLLHLATFDGLGIRETGGKMTVNGCLLVEAVIAKWWSHYPVDGTYGNWGDGLDLNGGQLEFNVPSGKIFDPRVGTTSTQFRRLMMTNGAKITFVGAGKGWPRAFASYLTDAMIQGAGSSTLTDYAFDFFAGSATDPTVTSDGGGVGLATDGSYHYARRVLFDQSGCVNIGTAAGAYYDWDIAACLRGKNTTTDWRVIGVNTIRNATALRRFKRIRVQHGANIVSTVAVNADENGLEFYGCTFKLLAMSFTNTRCKAWGSLADGWNEWEVPDANGQSASSIPCNTIVGAYICTGRGTVGNPKVLNAANGAFSAVPVFSGRGYMEISQETNVGSNGDAGEFYQHDKEHRSGTSFTGWTFLSAEDGTAFRVAEVAALSNTGNNTTQPPTAGQEFGQVTFTTCRGNIGTSAFGQGHTPGTDCPGFDVWRVIGGTWVGAHANATGSVSQNYSNNTGPATIAGLVLATVDANYVDSVLVAQVTGNRIIHTSSGAKKSDGNPIWAQAAGWGIQQSAQNAAATITALQTANAYYADWGRSADLANYLNSRPGGGPEGPGRRLRTYYLVRAGVANGADTAARTVQYTTAWNALAAQDMGAHLAFGSAHPDYVSGLTSVGLADFVDADWAGGPAFPTALTAGSLTLSGVTSRSVDVLVGVPTGGTAPYSAQVQRGLGASPGSWANVGSAMTGGFGSLTDSGLTASTQYSYRVQYTDAVPTTVTGTPQTVTTLAAGGGGSTPPLSSRRRRAVVAAAATRGRSR
jgi:hypothetical protein